jgi:hypothetical protein
MFKYIKDLLKKYKEYVQVELLMYGTMILMIIIFLLFFTRR